MKNNPVLMGVVMDPIDGIVPKKDSTLAMLLAAQARGHRIVYLQQKDLQITQGGRPVTGGCARSAMISRHGFRSVSPGPARSQTLTTC